MGDQSGVERPVVSVVEPFMGLPKRIIEPFNHEKNDEKNHQNRQKRQNHQKRRFSIIRH
jgi:hypothetical protein